MQINDAPAFEEVAVIFLDLVIPTIGTHSIVIYKGRDTLKETKTEFLIKKRTVDGVEDIKFKKSALAGWSIRDVIVRKAVRPEEQPAAKMRKVDIEDLRGVARDLQPPGL